MEPLATEKQIAFVKSLLDQKVVKDETRATMEAATAPENPNKVSKKQASNWIEWLLAQPKVEKPKSSYIDPPEGMHVVPSVGGAADAIFKVYKTRNGHIVAAQLVKVGSTGEWGFDYQGKRGLSGLSEATRMPADEAKKFGKTYGICVRCAKSLSDERSIFAGYGKWCADAEGWVYPKMSEALVGLGVIETEDEISLESLLLSEDLGRKS